MTCLGHILMALNKIVPWRLTCAAPGVWLRRAFPVVPYPSASPSSYMKLHCSASGSCWINFSLSFNCARHCKFRLVVLPLSLIKRASICSFRIWGWQRSAGLGGLGAETQSGKLQHSVAEMILRHTDSSACIVSAVSKWWHPSLNLLKTKRNLLYIRTQSVPRCRHFPPRL